jgi:tetratricopeptide (TPR) repeat protein
MHEQPDIMSLAARADADHSAYGDWLTQGIAVAKPAERRLNQHGARRDAPLLIETPHALAGAALLASWTRRYRSKHPEAIVLMHHVGCTSESRQLDNLLFRLLSAIRDGHGLLEPIPLSREARIEVLPNRLARAGALGRVIIAISGLDALEGDEADQGMYWLPYYLPAGVRLVVTSAPGVSVPMWRQRGWQNEVAELSPLAAEASDPEAALEVAAPVLKLLWGARRGLETGFLERLEANAGHQLEQAAGLVYPGASGWCLAGPAVQDQVRRRLLRDGAEQQAIHLHLAEAHADRESPQALDALPWLLPAAAHWQGLAEWLGDARVLTDMLRPERRGDLLNSWREWGAGPELVEFYQSRLPLWRVQLEPAAFVDLLVELARALLEVVEEPRLEPFFQAAGEVADVMEHPALAAAHGAWLSDVEQRYAEAEPLLRSALALRTATLGDDHGDTRSVRHQLATVLEASGDLAGATDLYKQTLEARERTLGERSADLIPHIGNLAAVYKAVQDFNRARPLYDRALALADRHYGNSHPTTAACLDNLAGLLYAGHDHEGAENLYQRALGVTEAAFGLEHPATAASAHNLGTLLDAREQYKAAEQLFRRALSIRQNVYGDEHADTASTLHNLAGALDAMGDAKQAEPMYRSAVATWEKLVGQQHPATATSINNLADLLRHKGEHEEAEGLYRRNLETWTALLGETHPHTLMTLAELGSLYADQHKTDIAEPMLRQAVQQTAEVLGHDSMIHIDSVIKLSVLLRDSGRREEGAELLRQTVSEAEGKISLLSPRLQKLRRHLEALEADPAALH